VYCILALLFALGPLNVFGWDYAVSFFCPADTFLSETTGVGFLWLMGSSFLAMFGLCGQISWFIPTPKRPRPADILLMRRQRIAAVAGACLLVIAMPIAVAGLSSSYCARPQDIFVRATPYGEGRIYAWTEVRKITAHCSRGHRGVWFSFDAEMEDGQTIPLGTRESQFIRNYRAVSDALRNVPFIYDNFGTSDCPKPSLRDLLAARPGARVNEPR
jgi:hypothetical protein